ncbi:hypothetical protein Sipo8835_10155 [Streptomyces ipomoeae]|uniref:Uncharacterized protein n=1 Tax=Streptomyces ipomoeae TaxID=103232 RepID=A0AAE8W4H6_9ACTN|nr:TIM barrel protein [Streptomyces ipomoeae]TQE36248.1 hypothetical protein Sipo7851_12720 [Streptomyces ipomoeae]TQE36482.1 hypothetical protein Sipo8835_10155 [Streptomyces ipomoeae]
MKLCIPFLLSQAEQFRPEWLEAGYGIEASLFDRVDIARPDRWDRVRANLLSLHHDHRPQTLIIHFPVNDCNYLDDPLVRDRLWEMLDLADRVGADGLVLHSNQVHTVDEWLGADLATEADRFHRFVGVLDERCRGAGFWIGLENMPLMGNEPTELDPLLCFPPDFSFLSALPESSRIGICWDLCHYSYSVHVAELLRSGALDEAGLYPRSGETGFTDFAGIADRIVHYHFSAFRGIASRTRATVCTEGVVPAESTLGPQLYRELARTILRAGGPARTVTFEIAEADYRRRTRIWQAIDWWHEATEGVTR